MSRRQMELFEDINFYLGMERPHDAQEFVVIHMRFNARGNVMSLEIRVSMSHASR